MAEIRYEAKLILEDDSRAVIAKHLKGNEVTPFLLGAFCGNADIGEYVCREDVVLVATEADGDIIRYKASISEAAKDKYDEGTRDVYMEMLVRQWVLPEKPED